MAQIEDHSSETEARERALRQAKEQRDFYSHVAIYVAVNLGLFVIDLLSGDGWWFYWATIFWGIGLLIQGIGVFGRIGPFQTGWEERKAEEILRREREKNRRDG